MGILGGLVEHSTHGGQNEPQKSTVSQSPVALMGTSYEALPSVCHPEDPHGLLLTDLTERLSCPLPSAPWVCPVGCACATDREHPFREMTYHALLWKLDSGSGQEPWPPKSDLDTCPKRGLSHSLAGLPE